jgi:Ca2+-binding EF-hand superfamily protein
MSARSTDSVFSEDEDLKVRRRLERDEKIKNDPLSAHGLDSLLEKTGLTLVELKEIQEIFQLVDSDHSGAIDAHELLTILTTVGIKSNQSEIDNMISECDPDNTGEIDFESFVGTVSKKVITSFTHSDMIKAFKR